MSKMHKCGYCPYRSEDFYGLLSHEYDEHRSERWWKFVRAVYGALLWLAILTFFGVPLFDYVMRFWFR